MPKTTNGHSDENQLSSKKIQKKKESNHLTEKDLIFRTQCIDTVRIISAECVEKANSGHPGAPMGCAPIAHVLFNDIMKFSPINPGWYDRDRFILSNGHACALLYTMLHLTGYDLSLDDLKAFRQLGSKTPGHPENFMTPGVEVSTGPLGQGISNAVGIAIAEAHLAAVYNKDDIKIVDHYTYVLCGDGCLQEGISSEACSLAGHLGLGKLIVCYDDNHVTIDGDTELSFTEDVGMRYESYGWHVVVVKDGNDIEELTDAIEEARAQTDKPSMIKIRTVIGFGSGKAGSSEVHGAPLGASDLAQVKTRFGFDPLTSFAVDEKVSAAYRSRRDAGSAAEGVWNTNFAAYSAKYPVEAAEFERRMKGELPADFVDQLLAQTPVYSPTEAKSAATRNRSEEVLNVCARLLPEIVGGSADLTPSTLTALKCSHDFQHNNPAGRYIRYGVREHAMAAISNGLFAHGGFRPFASTFMNFIGYALGSVRVSALSRFGVLYIMTHDSIGLGEDGPTHQPVEMLECLRALPNLLLFRPCDGNETKGAYQVALQRIHTPSVLSFSRQATPTLEHTSAQSVQHGAYILEEYISPGSTRLDLILVSSGTEVALTRSVALKLTQEHGLSVRVVSMPCWELFDEQSQDYQLSVFPAGTPVMSIEASGAHGWNKYAHVAFGLHSYGLSAPAKDVYAFFGFTVPNLVEKSLEVVAFYKNLGIPVPSLMLYPRFEKKAH